MCVKGRDFYLTESLSHKEFTRLLRGRNMKNFSLSLSSEAQKYKLCYIFMAAVKRKKKTKLTMFYMLDRPNTIEKTRS